MKSNKGITLIALVVTIIVLLILAGISIAMLTGDNGILGNANKSKSNNAYYEAEETMKLAYMAVRTEIAAKTVADSSYKADEDIARLLTDVVNKDLKDGTNYKTGWDAKVDGTTKIVMTYTNSAINKASVKAAVAAEGENPAQPAVPAYKGYVNGEIELTRKTNTSPYQSAKFTFDTAKKTSEIT